jgi:hypothetical protein
MDPITRDAIWMFEKAEKADLAKTRAEQQLRALLRRVPQADLAEYYKATEELAGVYSRLQQEALNKRSR